MVIPAGVRTSPRSRSFTDKKGKIYKQVYYYVVNLDSCDFYIPDVISKEQLQLEEVDWAGFVTIEEAKTKILWRFKNIF